MGKRYIDNGVKCPYYCSEGQQKIYCVGFQEEQWLHVAFQSKTDMKEYKYSRCRSKYDKCPVFRIVSESEPS